MKDREFAEQIQEMIDFNRRQPERLNARLNLKLTDCSKDELFADFQFDVEEWCLNPYGGVHGGAICSLFDTSIGIGAVALTQHFVSTTDLTVSYLRPMNGKKYIFKAEYTHVGRRMVRATGKAVDAETGMVCATALASYMVTETRAKGLQV